MKNWFKKLVGKDKPAAENKNQHKSASAQSAVMMERVVCTDNQHAEPAFKCFNDFCMNKICSRCAHPPDENNNILCKLCTISAVNMNGMAFDSSSDEEEKGFSGSGLKQNAHVYFDR